MKRVFYLITLLSFSLIGYSQTAQDYNRIGNNKMLQKDYLGAIADYSKAIDIDSKFAVAYYNRGNAKASLQDYKGAIADFSNVMELYHQPTLTYIGRSGDSSSIKPTYPRDLSSGYLEIDFYYYRGRVKYELGVYEGAIADFTKAIEEYPKSTIIYYPRSGNSYPTKHSINLINPVVTNSKNYRGRVKYELGDYEGAIADFTKAIIDDPTYGEAYSNRGSTKARLQDYRGAIADFSKAIEINLKDYNVVIADRTLERMINPNARAYGHRGHAKYELGDYDGAITDFTKAVDIDTEYADAYNHRGRAKYELGDYEGAIADFTKAIEINPEDADTYYNRGNVKNRLDDYGGAIADFSKAIEIDPKYAVAYYRRGLAKVATGKKESGCLDLSKAGELGYAKSFEAIKEFCNN